MIRQSLKSAAEVNNELLILQRENANALALQAISRRAKAQGSFRGKRAELFLQNPVDQVTAMMSAPVSPETAALLGKVAID